MVMWKRIVLVLLLSTVVIGCSNNGNTRNVTVHYGASEQFNAIELESAANVIQTNFKKFRDCEMTGLWYEELESNRYTGKDRNKLVFFSNINIGSIAVGAFLPNTTYTNCMWVLTRENSNSQWKVESWGY